MPVEIANQDKRKEELMKTFQKYDREQSMFQNCTLRMLMDQQDIIHEQKRTIEKKKHQLTELKTTTYKNNSRTRKKTERNKQTEETKKKFHNPLPFMQREDI